MFAGFKNNAARRAVFDKYLADVTAIPERGTLPFCAGFKRARKRVHATLDQPDALLLHVRDKHESGGSLERRRAAIGGVAPEELTESRIFEVAAQGTPQSCEG